MARNFVQKNGCRPRSAAWFRAALLLVLLLTFCGCVRRKLTLRTNPPGATAYLDHKPIGKTPLTTSFDHYGDRRFTFVKEGYETKTVILPVRAPWYQWIGLDFVSEVLLPGTLKDEKFYEVDLVAQQVTSPDILVAQAEETRRLTHSGHSLRLVDPLTEYAPPQPYGGSIGQAAPVLPPAPTAVPYAPQSLPNQGLGGTTTELPTTPAPFSPLSGQ